MPTETSTPEPPPPPSVPQIQVGIPAAAIDEGRCGFGAATVDHDPNPGQTLSYWDVYPMIGRPGFSTTTPDGFDRLGFCTRGGEPIVMIGEGRAAGVNADGNEIEIELTSGDGAGQRYLLRHVSLDRDAATEGLQALEAGASIGDGEVIGYTMDSGDNLDTLTSVQVTAGEVGPDQENSLIGPDGQPNIR